MKLCSVRYICQQMLENNSQSTGAVRDFSRHTKLSFDQMQFAGELTHNADCTLHLAYPAGANFPGGSFWGGTSLAPHYHYYHYHVSSSFVLILKYFHTSDIRLILRLSRRQVTSQQVTPKQQQNLRTQINGLEHTIITTTTTYFSGAGSPSHYHHHHHHHHHHTSPTVAGCMRTLTQMATTTPPAPTTTTTTTMMTTT